MERGSTDKISSHLQFKIEMHLFLPISVGSRPTAFRCLTARLAILAPCLPSRVEPKTTRIFFAIVLVLVLEQDCKRGIQSTK